MSLKLLKPAKDTDGKDIFQKTTGVLDDFGRQIMFTPNKAEYAEGKIDGCKVSIYKGKNGFPPDDAIGKNCNWSAVISIGGQHNTTYRKVWFEGVSQTQEAQQPTQPRQQPSDQKDTYWKDKSDWDKTCELHKNRGIALSYAIKLLELKVLKVYGDSAFFKTVDVMVGYMQDGIPHALKQDVAEKFAQEHNIPSEKENGPDYPQGASDEIPY